MSTYTYQNKKLINKRKKLRLTISDVAKALTLSETQIKSLENNLEIGFASPKYKLILLKRYAKLLDIDLDSLIEMKVNSDNDKQNELSQKTIYPIISNKINYFIFAIIISIFTIYLFNSTSSNSENQIPTISDTEQTSPEDASLPVTLPENLPTPEDNLDIVKQENLPYELTEIETIEQSAVSNSDNLSEMDLANSSENIITEVSEEFLCTVDTAELKSFSTRNPEKSSYYFYIISHDPQKICVIDALGAFKEYDFQKGDKISHHGSPPFKIQLNPKASEIYFEGWKVNLQEDDYFIQLNPSSN